MTAFECAVWTNRRARPRVTPPLISDLDDSTNRGAAFDGFRSTTTKRSTWTRTHVREYNASSGNSYDGEMCDSEKIKCGRSVRRRIERASGCKQGIFWCGSFIIIECAALMARRGSRVALPAPRARRLTRPSPRHRPPSTIQPCIMSTHHTCTNN